MTSLADQFLLDPAVTFLNHGSFGATPRPVFAAYQAWQRKLERQPVAFIGRHLTGYLAEARAALGDFLNVAANDLVFVPNPTFGVNVVVNSLQLAAGDEVLTSNHEYGACLNAWQFHSERRGFRVVQQPIALPVTTPEAIVEQIWQGVTPRTKVIFLSHITSPTALCLPVQQICARAREAGILTLIDGAHAPGQMPLDLAAVDADFYTATCHKWVCAPKGTAFLYAHPRVQELIEPLIVGWGWGNEKSLDFGSSFLDKLQFLGTRDFSPYLTVPNAIEFQQEHNWTAVRAACHALLNSAIDQISRLTGLDPIYPKGQGFYHQMAAIPLPQLADHTQLKAQLYDEFQVEVPIISWNGRYFIRVSIQAYNTPDDVEKLLYALDKCMIDRAVHT